MTSTSTAIRIMLILWKALLRHPHHTLVRARRGRARACREINNQINREIARLSEGEQGAG